MEKILAVHEPHFLPWLGFFHKMVKADVFVLLDDVLVPEGRSLAKRVRIKTPTGPQWLGLPILQAKGGQPQYRDQKLPAGAKWIKRISEAIDLCYRTTPHYNYGGFEGCYIEIAATAKTLFDLNGSLINWARMYLDIQINVSVLSGFKIEKSRTERIIALCKEAECEVYLSDEWDRPHNSKLAFIEAGIELRYHKFNHPTYPQLWGEFRSGLSIIDLLFNCGPDSLEVLLNDHG